MGSNVFDANIDIRPSSINGRGIFARIDMKKGDLVYAYPQGEIITEAQIELLSPEQQSHLDVVGDGLYEMIQPPGCYINHSCEPNAYEQDHRAYALRDIEAGEEVTIDYGRVAYLDPPLRCECGKDGCRKVIYGAMQK